MSFQVRPAVLSDAAGLAAVHVAAWQRGYAGMLPDDLLSSLTVPTRTTRWHDILSADPPRALTLIAADEGGVVGFASVGPSRDEDAGVGTGELWAIYVHPERWGAGVGYALHGEALEVLRDRAVVDVTLWVLVQNVRGRRFYERQGWRPDGAEKVGHMGEVPLDEVRYRRRLMVDD